MPRIGYARVSTTDQVLDIQIARLKAAGCDIVRHETGSGASRSGRTELETIMQFLRAGDELVVLRLDRLGRSTRDVLNLVHELDEKGASLRVLEPEVTTAGDMGRMVITILGMVADMELKFIKDRQRAGIEAAKAEGIYKGRKKSVDDEEIRAMLSQGLSKAEVARQLGISRMTVYRALQTDTAATITPAEPAPLVLPNPPKNPTPAPVVPVVQSEETESAAGYRPTVVPLILSLEVEINRQGTRGRKRAIADIEDELAAWWDLADETPAGGDYAISTEFYPDEAEDLEALDRAAEQLIHDLGEIADRRYCYIKATVTDPATGRTWSGVEPAKALRRRRPPKRKQPPARRKRKSPSVMMFDRFGMPLNADGHEGQRYVIRKGAGSSAVYYVDADDRQSAWHADIAKARRFATYDSADDLLYILLDGDELPAATDDYDILPA